MDEIIRTENLSKRYRHVTAVDNVSLSVSRGEIYGFLGLNGAGKTTTIRMLLGMISPTTGQAFLKGERVTPGCLEMWKLVGYLVEIPYAYPELSTRENINTVRQYRRLPKSTVDEVIDKLSLKAYQDRPAKHLSLGNKQRLGLAKAIIHKPDILILDEPANGLDPAGIVEIRKLLIDLARNHGVTIFISSHILGEISKFATRVGIIHEGCLVQELSIEELEQYRQRTLWINTQDNEAAMAVLRKNNYAPILAENGKIRLLGEDAIGHPETANQLLVEAGYAPSTLVVEEEELEDYFLRILEERSDSTTAKVAS